jgi:hypothetical protein
MELKDDCKQTDVGVVPEEWEVKDLGSLRPFVTSGSRGWAPFYSDYGSPFIRITNMSRESIYLDLTDLKYVNLPPEAKEGTRTRLQEHDVLISITADIGIVGYVTSHVPQPAYINQHLALVRFDASSTDTRFVSYLLASEHPQKLFRALTDTGAKAGMSLLTIRKLRVAFPPLTEQRAVAAALGDVDACWRAHPDHHKKLTSSGHDARSSPARPACRGLRSGRSALISDVAAVKTGPFGSSLHERDYVQGGTPIITVEHLGEFGVTHHNLPLVSDVDRHRLRAYSLEFGDIVFSRVGSVDRNALIREAETGWLFSGRLLRVRPDKRKTFAPYLSYQFHGETFKRKVRDVAVGWPGVAQYSDSE